jgi:hypothetical protein
LNDLDLVRGIDGIQRREALGLKHAGEGGEADVFSEHELMQARAG